MLVNCILHSAIALIGCFPIPLRIEVLNRAACVHRYHASVRLVGIRKVERFVRLQAFQPITYGPAVPDVHQNKSFWT
jgi:hypothetical protein